jgi:hypothetical protein
MAKNVVIYSDGTGQAGGFHFDEDRSNVYKLYRATRCCPDSSIDPREQSRSTMSAWDRRPTGPTYLGAPFAPFTTSSRRRRGSVSRATSSIATRRLSVCGGPAIGYF